MQRYIDQLIEDLRNARQNVPKAPDFGENNENFEAAMDAILHAPEKPPKQNFGVSYEELPPPERLSHTQMETLVKEIILTIEAFGMFVEFHSPNVPIELKYKLLRKTFAKKMPYMPGWHFDFCSGNCPDCELSAFCDSWKGTYPPEEMEKGRQKMNNDE